jgi:integrase
MSLRSRALPAGFIAPCLPTNAPQPPSGEEWLHEIKHDGFRVIARKDGARVKLYSRPGNDLTKRFPLIVEALARLRSRSCTHEFTYFVGRLKLKEEDFPRVKFHDLRHSHATQLLGRGIHPKIVQERLGHSTICGDDGPIFSCQ